MQPETYRVLEIEGEATAN